VRHARAEDLDGIAPLLDNLRALPGLREKSPGVFYRGSKAFLHFHVDDGAYYADVRLDGVGFERMRATTKAEQRALVQSVRAAQA
jgi:hypothetical protein